MNTLVTIAMVFGALGGFGIYLLLRGMLPAGPSLGAALQRVHTPGAAITPAQDSSALGRWLVVRFGDRLRPPRRELMLIGQSVERYIVEKVCFPLVGLLFPWLITFLAAVIGITLPFVIPVAVSLGLAALFFILVDVSIRQKAADAREEFVRAVAVYLDLVALQRSASHGPVESLERAARGGSGWVFERIRESLAGARFANIAPWDGLSQVADEIGVPELGDVGDIMRLSGTEGAQVYTTLVSRADSLRGALSTKERNRANTDTTLLYIPASLTVLVLFVLAAYPFLYRLAAT